MVEIAHDIERSLPALNRSSYVSFLRENPAFLPLVKQRSQSYRDCYYAKYREADYPGLRIVATLEDWLRAS